MLRRGIAAGCAGVAVALGGCAPEAAPPDPPDEVPIACAEQGAYTFEFNDRGEPNPKSCRAAVAVRAAIESEAEVGVSEYGANLHLVQGIFCLVNPIVHEQDGSRYLAYAQQVSGSDGAEVAVLRAPQAPPEPPVWVTLTPAEAEGRVNYEADLGDGLQVVAAVIGGLCKQNTATPA
jgi:hypothetical protein